jgi:hypothetical protein
MAQMNPQLLQFLAQKMGDKLTPEVIQGFMLGLGAQELSKQMTPKQPKQPQMQAGGQVQINKQVAGPGPLRSGTQPDQIQALASLMANQQIAQQMAKLPPMNPHQGSAPAGIPGVPGPVPFA